MPAVSSPMIYVREDIDHRNQPMNFPNHEPSLSIPPEKKKRPPPSDDVSTLDPAASWTSNAERRPHPPTAWPPLLRARRGRTRLGAGDGGTVGERGEWGGFEVPGSPSWAAEWVRIAQCVIFHIGLLVAGFFRTKSGPYLEGPGSNFRLAADSDSFSGRHLLRD